LSSDWNLSYACYKSCPDKYIKKEVEKKCIKCDPSCETCSGETPLDCLTCKTSDTVRVFYIE